MIRIHINAVLRVLDGFTGQPLAPSALRCTVDGRTVRPTAKEGGYYVLTGLSSGEHQVVLQGLRYLDEHLTLRGGEEKSQSLLVTMKPGANYPFGAAVTWLTMRVEDGKRPLPGRRVWIAAKNPLAELRIAQDAVHAGDEGGRLFFPACAKALSLPRDFLLLDGTRSEICRVEELAELEASRFAAPLRFDHKRSCSLYPAQVYTADETGMIRAVFREPAPVEVLAEGSEKPVSFDLQSGTNEMTLSLEK